VGLLLEQHTQPRRSRRPQGRGAPGDAQPPGPGRGGRGSVPAAREPGG
jgi:hypothetical protein